MSDAETVPQTEPALVEDVKDCLRYNRRLALVVYAAMASTPVFSLLMDRWVGASWWWQHWPGEWLQYGFGVAWLIGVFALASTFKFFGRAKSEKAVAQAVRTMTETDPLALEAAVPTLRQFARSWDINKEHRQTAREALKRIEVARQSIGNLPVEASAPIVSTEDLPVATETPEAPEPSRTF